MLAGPRISPERQQLLRATREFGRWIAAKQDFIPDYGDAIAITKESAPLLQHRP